MSDKKVLFLGEKETFITRVLINKAEGAGAVCCFIQSNINMINSRIHEAGLLALCMADKERPSEEVLHFLCEKMEELELKIIVVGERLDVEFVCDHIPGKYIFKNYVRPVDNDVFAKDVSEYMEKVAAGEFRKSILIVDDDPSYLKLVREWLKDDFKVSMANSGLQAIKWLGKNTVDLILLDHEMPVTTGPQVLEMLRSDSETKSIPVIFLTGKSDKESVMKVVTLKPEGYFLKDIQKDDLIRKIKEFFILRAN